MIEVRDPLSHVSEEFPPGYYISVEQHLTVKAQSWIQEKQNGSDALDTSDEKIEEIRQHILATNPSEKFMQEYWPGLAKKLKNPALAELIQIPHGADGLRGDSSEFLPMLLCTLPKATALEIAFLHGVTTKLEFAELTARDPYYNTAICEKLFKYIRMRSAWSADVMAKSKPRQAAFLSCGRMFAKRYIDPTIYGGSYLVDIDQDITLESLFPNKNVRNHYKLFHIPDEEFLRGAEPESLEFVEMLGRAIYMFTKDDCDILHKFFELTFSRMAKGGRLVFDVNCYHHDWDKLLLPMSFKDNADKIPTITLLENNAAITEVFLQKVFYDLPLRKIRFEPLRLGDQDMGVLFCLTKSYR